MQPRDSDTNIGLLAFYDKTEKRNEIYFRNGYENRKNLTELIRGVEKTSFYGMSLRKPFNVCKTAKSYILVVE